MKHNILFLLSACLSYGSMSAQIAKPIPETVSTFEYSTFAPDGKGDTIVYYLYNKEAKAFLTEGNRWGTQASIGDKGIKVAITKHLDEEGNWDGKTVVVNNFTEKLGRWDELFIQSDDNNVDYNKAFVDRHSIDDFYRNDNLFELEQQSIGAYRIKCSDLNTTINSSITSDGTSPLFGISYLNSPNTTSITATIDYAIDNNSLVDWFFVTKSAYEKYWNNIIQYEFASMEHANITNPVYVTDRFIINPKFIENINGWNTTYIANVSATNIGYRKDRHETDADVIDNYAYISNFIEAWQNYNLPLGDGKLYQTIPSLPRGLYKLSADCLATGPDGLEISGAQFFAQCNSKDYFVECATVSDFAKHYELLFESDGSDVTIGMRTVNTTANWIAADNFKLEYYGTIKQLNDGEAFDETEDMPYNTITYTRSFSNTKWQALYVPFSMSYDDWKDEFEIGMINDVNMYDTDDNGEYDVTEVEILKLKKGTLKPNTPYFIRAKKAGEKVITLADATLYPAEENSINCSSTQMRFTFTGTYSGVSGNEMFGNDYYALGGGSLGKAADSSVSLKPMRWYMSVESRGSLVINPTANIRIRVVGEDIDEDEETGIADIAATAVNGRVYTLDGREVNGGSIKAGIYIKNGKKYIVK